MSLQKIIGTGQDNQLRDIVVSDFKISKLARTHLDSAQSEILNNHVVSAKLDHVKWLSGQDYSMVTDITH
jgi:hypothetical protein